MNQDDCKNKNCALTLFLQIQKNQLCELEVNLEQFCIVIPLFGVNSAKYDLNLIKGYFFPILVKERDNEPTAVKKAKQLMSFKFGSSQPSDILNFLGGATGLDSFLKARKTSETN